MRGRHDWIFNPSVMLANAMTAFILNLAVFLLIGKTSALTMNIAGVIKDWMLIFFSWSVFKAPVTATNLLGYIFCCSGVVVYNHMKLQALKASVATTSTGKDSETGKPTGDPPRASVTGGGGGGGSGGGSMASDSSQERSKEDILSEIRRLQSEMSALEDRVSSSSAKMLGATGDVEAPSASQATPAPTDFPPDSKDK